MVFPGFRIAALMLALSGCVVAPDTLSKSAPLPPGVPCAGGGSAACFFRNAPVRLSADSQRLPQRLLPYFTTIEPLSFVDGARRQFEAPRGTLTDGASIPILFQPLLGNPRDPLFLNAGVLHDAYCGIGNEGGPRWHADTWQNVHVMFFDALVVAGTPEVKAKVMFAAVWLGGPRWDDHDRSLEHVPDNALYATFASVKTMIERENPSLDDLIARLDQIEEQRLRKLALQALQVDGGAAGVGALQGNVTAITAPSPEVVPINIGPAVTQGAIATEAPVSPPKTEVPDTGVVTDPNTPPDPGEVTDPTKGKPGGSSGGSGAVQTP